MKKRLLPLLIVSFFLMYVPLFAQAEETLREKTLLVWVAPETLEQKGGSVLTVNDLTVDQFDGIVFGEIAPGVWMAGSNNWQRTNREQNDRSRETVGPEEFVRLAIVYDAKTVKIYRNEKLIDEYESPGTPAYRVENTGILFGQRHYHHVNDFFKGKIRDARVYAQALDAETIAAARPGKAFEGIEPWAWWDFQDTGIYDKTGRFTRVELSGGAKLENGLLVLSGESPRMFAQSTTARPSGPTVSVPDPNWSKDRPVPDAVVLSTRVFREKLLEDPYRPGYHFAIPEDKGRPGDPNGCFYANGRYHLMYLYERRKSGCCWGHLSSLDLVHWRHHKDAIGPGDGDSGCYSGGGFVDEDGTAYLTYWMLWGDKGIGIASSSDPHYEHWKKFDSNPVIKSDRWGITEINHPDGTKSIVGSADPTNIWKKGGKYYMGGGNLIVLNELGRKDDSPEKYQGDHLYLFESENLRNWTYKGEFYQRNPEWTDRSEDNMCPSFLPLPSGPDGGEPSGKHLLLFISHNKGCQYYVGTYDTQADKFIPENHGRMSWGDNTYFAPEALVDAKGRQIMWAWLMDNPDGEKEKGWSGVFGLPRTLWVGEDGTLRMKPVPELEMLRFNPVSWENVRLESGEVRNLENLCGDFCELEINVTKPTTGKVGLKVRASENREEETLLYYDAETGSLVFDSTRSGTDGRKIVEKAPFVLKEGESLQLRVFIDKSVIEVYANDRQGICRRVYPARNDSLGIRLFTEGGDAEFSRIQAWEMMPSNPY